MVLFFNTQSRILVTKQSPAAPGERQSTRTGPPAERPAADAARLSGARQPPRGGGSSPGAAAEGAAERRGHAPEPDPPTAPGPAGIPAAGPA
jgi:hypothetical protein